MWNCTEARHRACYVTPAQPRLTRKVQIDRRKEHAFRRRVDLGTAGDELPSSQDTEADFQRVEISQRALSLVTPREAECLRLRAEGFRYREIAQVLGIEPGTVGALLARAVARIRETLEGKPEGRQTR